MNWFDEISKDEIHIFEVAAEDTIKVSTIVAAGTTLSTEIPLFVDMQDQKLPKLHYGKVFILPTQSHYLTTCGQTIILTEHCTPI